MKPHNARSESVPVDAPPNPELTAAVNEVGGESVRSPTASSCGGSDVVAHEPSAPLDFKAKHQASIDARSADPSLRAGLGPSALTPERDRTESTVVREPINATLRDHVIGAVDWELRPLVETLHDWWNRFNERFFGGRLTPPALSFDPDDVRRLGWYHRGRDALGLRHRINVNRRILNGPLAEVLATLLHEALHAEQEMDGTAAKGNYHNVAFRARARGLGIPCDEAGRDEGVAHGPFDAMLKEFGVATVEIAYGPARSRPRGASTLKKWRCGCTNVRAAVEIRATCDRCSRPFVRAD